MLIVDADADADVDADVDADADADADADVERCTELVFGGKRPFKVLDHGPKACLNAEKVFFCY